MNKLSGDDKFWSSVTEDMLCLTDFLDHFRETNEQ